MTAARQSTVGGTNDSTVNGIYHSVRTATNTAFPAATKLTGVIQSFSALSGLSADRLTVFVTIDFATQILTRASPSDAFSAPATSIPPFQAFRIVPIERCSVLIGTSEPGDCPADAIGTWAKM